jgi:hypothetical protein
MSFNTYSVALVFQNSYGHYHASPTFQRGVLMSVWESLTWSLSIKSMLYLVADRLYKVV